MHTEPKGSHLLSMFSAALPHCFWRRSLSPQIRWCSLSRFSPPENVLFPVVFALAPVTLGPVSSFFLLSLLLSSTHPLRPCTFLSALLFIRFFFFCHLIVRVGNVLSPLHSGRFFFGSYVKVLSVASWNYLGAKLIALDPTSHCNRLSANLGSRAAAKSGPGSGCTKPSAPLKVLTFATHRRALHCHISFVLGRGDVCEDFIQFCLSFQSY